jgi:hypothetical protein
VVELVNGSTNGIESTQATATNATSGSGSNNVSTPAVTTTHSPDMLVSFFVEKAGTASAGTSPNTFSYLPVIQGGVLLEYFTQASAGAITPTATDSASGDGYLGITVVVHQ